MPNKPAKDEIVTTAPESPAPAAPKTEDLSQAIERSVDKELHDRVKCVRVFGNFYRCNWWAPLVASNNKALHWMEASTHHVRKSTFYTAKITDGQLVIEEAVKA